MSNNYVGLHFGDNLDYLKRVQTGSVELIYLDPPFNSKADYNIVVGGTQVKAFSDTWGWGTEDLWSKANLLQAGGRVADWANGVELMVGQCGMLSYLYYMAERILECSRVLSKNGSIWLHCDDAAAHLLRGLMDAVFGPQCYKNTVTWKRTDAHSNSDRFGRISDSLLYYARPSATWNGVKMSYSQDYVEKWFKFEDERGRYRTNALTGGSNSTTRTGDSFEPWKGVILSPGRNWTAPRKLCEMLDIDQSLPTRQKLDLLDEAGMIVWPKKGRNGGPGTPLCKQYLTEDSGIAAQDIWDDISQVGSRYGTGTKSEDVGYATQKPLALLERIISSCTNEGDMVLDPFVGSGTTVVAAAKMGRHAAGCDITYLAISLAEDRLREIGFKVRLTGNPTTMEDADTLSELNKWQYQAWILSRLGIGSEREEFIASPRGADKGIDGQHYNPITKVRTIVSVKGGGASNGGASAIRDLIGTVLSTRSDRGVFVCRKAPSAQMIEAATSAGLTDDGRPKVIIVTQEDIINGKCPNLNKEW